MRSYGGPGRYPAAADWTRRRQRLLNLPAPSTAAACKQPPAPLPLVGPGPPPLPWEPDSRPARPGVSDWVEYANTTVVTSPGAAPDSRNRAGVERGSLCPPRRSCVDCGGSAFAPQRHLDWSWFARPPARHPPVVVFFFLLPAIHELLSTPPHPLLQTSSRRFFFPKKTPKL